MLLQMTSFCSFFTVDYFLLCACVCIIIYMSVCMYIVVVKEPSCAGIYTTQRTLARHDALGF